MNERKYDSALFYLKLADTEFSSSLWCHYFPSNWRSDLLRSFATVYESMGDSDKAIDFLTPHIISDQVNDKLVALLKKYRNIELIKKSLQHLEDSISIEYGSVWESPKTIIEYNDKNGQVLRETKIEEYGRIAKWHFLGHQFFTKKTNDYNSNRVKGEGKRRKLETPISNDKLIQLAKEYIQNLSIYKKIMKA